MGDVTRVKDRLTLRTSVLAWAAFSRAWASSTAAVSWSSCCWVIAPGVVEARRRSRASTAFASRSTASWTATWLMAWLSWAWYGRGSISNSTSSLLTVPPSLNGAATR